MKRSLKELCWKVGVLTIWNVSFDFPFEHLGWWKEFVAYMGFYILLDIIRWGLKN